jgi:alkanesulfonate monooxygenase SsuD/methylene tetrahydromethanopterin reductase-like flavin-dependent oxidoreductase (luciferase family)
MRLGYFTMPLHPAHRAPSLTLEEDREAVILADKLGFYDAFVGEHLTEKSENVTNSFIFLATLVHATERIKLATGTSNLSHSHPALIASHAAMFDHLARGRFIFGVSPGALRSDAEALGLLDEDRNRLFADAIDVILAIWERDAPYDIDFPGNRFKVTTAATRIPEINRGELYKPYQRPRPEIVGTVVAAKPLGKLCGRKAKRRTGRRPCGLARGPHDLCCRRRRTGPALRRPGPGKPVPVLLAHDGQEDAILESPHCLQDPGGAG